MPRHITSSDRRGSAFVVVVVFGLLMAGILISLQLAASSQTQASIQGDLLAQRMVMADNGLAKGKAILLRNHQTLKVATPPATGATTIVNETFGPDSLLVTAQHLEGASYPFLFRLRSTATIRGEFRRLELLIRIEQPTPPTVGLPFLGAVIAAGNIQVTGNITIDGRDHDTSGNYNAGGIHVPGTLTTGTVDDNGGSSQIGGIDGAGNAAAPTHDPGSPMTTENSSAFAPEANPNDGVDDDGDTLIDENGFPKSPAEFFQLNPLNTSAPSNAGLKARAQGDGTWFTTKAAYNAWLSSTTPADRGGKVIYLELPNGNEVLGQFDLPDNPPPASPSIVIIQHKEVVDDEDGPNPAPDRDGDGKQINHQIEIGPLHVAGTFQGLLMCDHVKNVNGNGTIVGAVVAFNGINLDNTVDPANAKFGNGNIDILFSSEVLANLPGATSPGATATSRVLLWREVR